MAKRSVGLWLRLGPALVVGLALLAFLRSINLGGE